MVTLKTNGDMRLNNGWTGNPVTCVQTIHMVYLPYI